MLRLLQGRFLRLYLMIRAASSPRRTGKSPVATQNAPWDSANIATKETIAITSITGGPNWVILVAIPGFPFSTYLIN